MRQLVRALLRLDGSGASWTLDSPEAMVRSQKSNVIRLSWQKSPCGGGFT